LKDYGNQKDDFEAFVWEITFSLDTEKNSQGHQDIRFYRLHIIEGILWILKRNH
jgi:hypothetical protein